MRRIARHRCGDERFVSSTPKGRPAELVRFPLVDYRVGGEISLAYANKLAPTSLKNELGQRLCRMVLAQMPIVLLDHLDARPTEQGNGQQVESIDDQVRDR